MQVEITRVTLDDPSATPTYQSRMRLELTEMERSLYNRYGAIPMVRALDLFGEESTPYIDQLFGAGYTLEDKNVQKVLSQEQTILTSLRLLGIYWWQAETFSGERTEIVDTVVTTAAAPSQANTNSSSIRSPMNRWARLEALHRKFGLEPPTAPQTVEEIELQIVRLELRERADEELD
jgi:DNA repair ATPase RecN